MLCSKWVLDRLSAGLAEGMFVVFQYTDWAAAVQSWPLTCGIERLNFWKTSRLRAQTQHGRNSIQSATAIVP
jgi:hypothetical protein